MTDTLNWFKEFSWLTDRYPFLLHPSFLVHTVLKAVRRASTIYGCPQCIVGEIWDYKFCFGPTYLNMRNFLTLLGFCFLICLPFIAIVDSALIPRETGVKSVYSQWDWIPPFLQETSFITVCSPMCSLGWEHRWSYSYYAGNSGKILVISMEVSHVIYCYCLVETSNLITTYPF